MELPRIDPSLRLALVGMFLAVGAIYAQEASAPDESAADGDKKILPAHVRVWTMLFDEKAPVVVQAKIGAAKDPTVLAQDSNGKPMKGPYIEVPKGNVQLILLSGGVPANSQSVDLVSNDYRTILVTRKGGALTLDVLQDPLPGQKDFVPTVRLFNFGSDRTAEIRLGGSAPVFLPPNSYILSPLSATGTIKVEVSLPDPKGGPPATSITDIDGKKKPSWSIVTIPDYRGNLRPRVSPDGVE